MNALFDTNIVIDALKGITNAESEYSRYDHVFISRITWMEALVGAKSDDQDLRDFLESRFDILPLDQAVAERAVFLRRKYRMRLPDAIIWATAQIAKVDLVTRNTKDFDPAWSGIRVTYSIS